MNDLVCRQSLVCRKTGPRNGKLYVDGMKNTVQESNVEESEEDC